MYILSDEQSLRNHLDAAMDNLHLAALDIQCIGDECSGLQLDEINRIIAAIINLKAQYPEK
jgi:hypothetical protein